MATNPRRMSRPPPAAATHARAPQQQDISGNAPGPAGNFVEGRKTLNFLLETRYEKALSLTISYNAFFDGGTNNVYRDRDNLGFFVKYQF